MKKLLPLICFFIPGFLFAQNNLLTTKQTDSLLTIVFDGYISQGYNKSFVGNHTTPLSGDTLIKFTTTFYYEKKVPGLRMIDIEDQYSNGKANLFFYYLNDVLLAIDVTKYNLIRSNSYMYTGKVRYYFGKENTSSSIGTDTGYPLNYLLFHANELKTVKK